MKIGIVINSNDPETVWNAFRFGTTSLLGGHEVKVFLLGGGVESENIESEKFNVKEQIGFLQRIMATSMHAVHALNSG